jgi:membrane-anchored glycerophosphoryl diester phosphodiesterase (GDPDase)
MFGLGGSEMTFSLGILIFLFLPFIINAYLAKSRGKSVILMLFLTVVFSWIVTLILAFMPKVQVVDADSS